ncbi:double-stranded RNA-binding protein 1-like isoform X2 [Durio zibethinus]|uniref:Double-stranded RNA-binding protein 1-like isoform X2 n=1 Tax=Durio zibethinus TaxID=66656 RepID=A0A6P6AUJ7_DURZI|nr:double-stranded RNA-binding protein 1-like isoform X2 [Durio zibethinus]
MPTNENFSGVWNCYVFKSRLQEYAQKMGLPTPVFETIKEGPSHEPSFRSTVIVNDVKYESLPGFFNRKAAEQSAAEVALTELLKAGEVNESISQPVEYAQKMNYAIPVYKCQKDEAPGRLPHFSCKVEIGGIRYIGAAAKTKKEAEIKAARTALLAIQSSTSESSDNALGNFQLTVIPCRKRAMETASNPDESVNVPKAKKTRFKKKMLKTKLAGNNSDHSQDKTTGNLVIGSDDLPKSEWVQTDSFIVSSETLGTEVMRNLQDTKIESDLSEQKKPSAEVALAPQLADNSQNGQLIAVNSIHSNPEVPDEENNSLFYDDLTDLVKLTDGDELASMVNDPTQSQMEASKIMPGLNQAVERIHANAGQA